MPAFLPSELPVRARTRHHWVALLRPTGRFLAIALAVLLVAALLDPIPMAFVFVVVFAGLCFLRWQTWRAEWVILTNKRIIRIQGVPETTSTEASLRIDRVSGARLIETVPGKILGYGTIELEGAGDHPSLRRLVKIADPNRFYLEIRKIIFDEVGGPDPDEGGPKEFATEPIPPVVERDRYGRRRHPPRDEHQRRY